MGLFDYLRKKPKPEAAEAFPDEGGPSPDYVLVHYALRQFALSEPLQFLYAMSTPDSEKLLDAAIQDVAKATGKPPTVKASQIQIHRTRACNFPCVVLQFPEPKDMAGAYMVALVLPVTKEEMETAELGEQIEPNGRYFTLEKGMSLEGENLQVLCEWSGDRHANYGDGPQPVVEQFVAAIEGVLS